MHVISMILTSIKYTTADHTELTLDCVYTLYIQRSGRVL